MTGIFRLMIFVAVCAVGGARAQVIQWNFGTSAAQSSPSTDSVDYVSGGDVTNGNSYGSTAMLTSSSPSSGSGLSGAYNACVVARTNAFSIATGGSAYFQFSLVPSAGYTFAVTNIAFGSRCTATGPLAFCVRSSDDSYAADLVSGTLQANSIWALKTATFAATSTVAGATVTYRIYGYSGAGNVGSGSANWRIDDLTVAVKAIAGVQATPPGIDPVSAQSVRVGQTLTFGLAITPTDGDLVTATNVTASAGVSGAWSLSNGLFSYVPAEADYGSRTFSFTAVDKDGTSAPVAVAVSVLKAVKPAVRMTEANGSYMQDFNTLATNGTSVVWDNAAEPLEAWSAYANAAAITSYRTGTGSATSGDLYSFGSATTNADRSLGSLAGSSTTYRYGVAFTNETGQAITNIAVRFTGEQWRVANGATNTLAFDYCVTNAVVPLNLGVWHRVNTLCFATPAVTNAGQGAGAIYRSAERSASLKRPLAPGQVVLLRWSDEDDAGNDHALAIDDVSVAWAAGAMPDAIPVGKAGAAENFNEMGSDAVAELLFLWRVESRNDAPRLSGSFAAASDRTANANAVVNFTYAGSYNFSATAAGDQAVGGLSSGTAAKSVTLFGKFRNVTGLALRRWTVRYSVEKYRNGTVSTAVRLLASTDGVTWTAVGDPTAFAADADTNGYAADARPGATVTVERRAGFASAVADGGVFYLAWQISAAEGDVTAGTQALGVDDVTVEPVYPGGLAVCIE